MPDHLHLVWLGLRLDTDQMNAMSFLRTYLEPALVGAAVRSRSSTVGDEVTSRPVGHDVRSASPNDSSRRRLQFQPQAHDSVLREKEREHGAFAKVCFYILNNPVAAELVTKPEEWTFCGAIVPGYPTLHPLAPDFWEKY